MTLPERRCLVSCIFFLPTLFCSWLSSFLVSVSLPLFDLSPLSRAIVVAVVVVVVFVVDVDVVVVDVVVVVVVVV